MKSLILVLLLSVSLHAQTAGGNNFSGLTAASLFVDVRSYGSYGYVPADVGSPNLSEPGVHAMNFSGSGQSVCPAGFAAGVPLRLSGGIGAEESVEIDSSTCPLLGGGAGTVMVTTAHPHSEDWVLSSATAGCQEALSVAGNNNLRLQFPSGSIDFYAPCRISGNGVFLAGTGPGGTTLNHRTPNVDGIQFVGSAQGNGLVDLQMIGQSASTHGWAVQAANQTYFTISNVFAVNWANGLSVTNATTGDIRNFYVRNINGGDGMLIDQANALNVNNFQTSSSTRCGAALHVVNGGNVVVSNSQLLGCDYGGLLNPARDLVVASVEFASTYFDHNNVAGLEINPAAGGAVVRTRCMQCWASSANGPGIQFNSSGGGAIDGFLATGGQFSDNEGNGVSLLTGSDIAFIGSTFSNNRGGSGLALGPEVNNLRVTGSSFGNGLSSWGKGTQAYGIRLNDGSPTNLNITGNIFQGNTRGAMKLPPTLTSVVLSSNIGIDDIIDTVDSSPAVALPPNSIVRITGSATIQTMTGYWTGRRVTVQFSGPSPGGFGAEGNIYFRKKARQNQSFDCVFDGSKWMCASH